MNPEGEQDGRFLLLSGRLSLAMKRGKRLSAAGRISEACQVRRKNGANHRIRTDDLLITNELLYRLS